MLRQTPVLVLMLAAVRTQRRGLVADLATAQDRIINLILVPILAHSQAVRAAPVEAQVLKAVAALRVVHNRVAVMDPAAERTALALRVAAVPRAATLLTLAAVLPALTVAAHRVVAPMALPVLRDTFWSRKMALGLLLNPTAIRSRSTTMALGLGPMLPMVIPIWWASMAPGLRTKAIQ